MDQPKAEPRSDISMERETGKIKIHNREEYFCNEIRLRDE